ncbi:phytanoyl-CoA dioxygenase family protein [Actinacidiphila acidipaludis]|uniref:Phytanoyl-CoA dioxygenase family protein n=1 Tax=Actinacidiphila acidipaludis TaxID=2873382 RepID=A0ABS7QD31_9ACTN|nr:phytanoyl-CoA dioxygenase family protein [Streptomyces acidipaludis]MBY8881037.1 phytanoyl-CoA dioxygenase family protein [Streptomyces acidipaludis]
MDETRGHALPRTGGQDGRRPPAGPGDPGDAWEEAFLRDGFVKLPGAVPRDTAEECAALLWQRTGCDPRDPATWTQPVHWVGDMSAPPFAAAANTAVLHAAFDRLTGAGRWTPRASLGSFPLRFPHAEEPDDAGWHIEASYQLPGSEQYFTNMRSRGRLLLMLFLFTDVGEDDAPTRVRVGSHLDVPKVLVPYGERGASVFTFAHEVDEASAHRPLAFATGRAGDVYLCHPFLVHAAQPHHGSRPRFMAQPPLHPVVDPVLERADGAYSPVERAIRRGLGLEPDAGSIRAPGPGAVRDTPGGAGSRSGPAAGIG